MRYQLPAHRVERHRPRICACAWLLLQRDLAQARQVESYQLTLYLPTRQKFAPVCSWICHRRNTEVMFDALVIQYGSAGTEMDVHAANHGHTFARDDSE